MRIKRRRNRSLLVAIAGTLVLAAAGCGSDGESESTGSPASKTGLAAVQEAGVLRVGFANEAPYAYSDNGELAGSAPDLLRAIFSEVGVEEVEGVLTEFTSLIPAINANRFDVIGAGMFVRAERCAQIAFGNPEFVLKQAMAVRKGNPKGIDSYASIKTNGAKLGLVKGGSEVDLATAAGIPDGQVQQFPDGPSVISALRSGRVDAVALTTLSLNDLLAKANTDEIELAEPFTEPVGDDGKPVRGYGAMGFRKQDNDLREAYNEKLAEFRKNGRWLEIMQKYGFTESELPDESVTVEELCAE